MPFNRGADIWGCNIEKRVSPCRAPILDTVSSCLRWVLTVKLKEGGRAFARYPP